MNDRDVATTTRIVRGIAAGAIAGVVAGFVMDRFQSAVSALLPSNGGEDEPATQKAADALMQRTAGHAVPDGAKPLAGQAVHYALGVGLVIAYGLAAEFRPAITAGYGTAFGIGAATLLDEGIVPAVGLGSAPWKTDLPTNLYSYASHLIFGGTAELVRRQVASTLTN